MQWLDLYTQREKLVEPMPVITDDRKMRVRLDAAFEDLKGDIADTGAELCVNSRAVDLYGLSNEIKSEMIFRTEVLETVRDQAVDYLEGILILLEFTPYYCIRPFDSDHHHARVTWTKTNCVGDTNLVLIKWKYTIWVFTEESDLVMFKIAYPE